MVNLENWLSLQISQGGIFIPLYMLIGGFLASFLPCVYPIYPILVRVLVGSSDKEKSHSRLIAYVLGVILVYAILGGAFLLGGSLLQNVYRSPYTNFLFSFLIFLMIISLWEHIYVPLFSPKSDLSTERTFLQIMAVGFASGLMTSACTAPVSMAFLLFLSKAKFANAIVGVLWGAFCMGLFGVGISIPMIWIGLANKNLPKYSGFLRSFVIGFFSIVMVYFSFSFFDKAFEILELKNSISVYFSLISIYYLMYSFFSVKDDSLQPNGTKSVLAFSIIILFLFVQFQLSKSSSPDIIPNNLEKISISGVDWRRDLEGSLLEAKNHDKKVFIDFSADWCTNCKVFESNLSKDTELQNAINEFSIPVRIEDTDPIFEKLQIDRRFEELKIGLPLYAVLASDGALIWKTNQFKDREGMIQALREVK